MCLHRLEKVSSIGLWANPHLEIRPSIDEIDAFALHGDPFERRCKRGSNRKSLSR
jgi:hypothetical protein